MVNRFGGWPDGRLDDAVELPRKLIYFSFPDAERPGDVSGDPGGVGGGTQMCSSVSGVSCFLIAASLEGGRMSKNPDMSPASSHSTSHRLTARENPRSAMTWSVLARRPRSSVAVGKAVAGRSRVPEEDEIAHA